MSITDDNTPIILDQIDQINSDFQKMFKTKFGWMKLSANFIVLVNFCKFYFFSRGKGERESLGVGGVSCG